MQGADFCLQLPIALYRDAINVYVLLIGMSNLTIENDTDKKKLPGLITNYGLITIYGLIMNYGLTHNVLRCET